MWLASKQKPDGCFRSVGTLVNNVLKVVENHFSQIYTVIIKKMFSHYCQKWYFPPNACLLQRALSAHLRFSCWTVSSSVSSHYLLYFMHNQDRITGLQPWGNYCLGVFEAFVFLLLVVCCWDFFIIFLIIFFFKQWVSLSLSSIPDVCGFLTHSIQWLFFSPCPFQGGVDDELSLSAYITIAMLEAGHSSSVRRLSTTGIQLELVPICYLGFCVCYKLSR